MLVVGERLNSTRKPVHQALEAGDEAALVAETKDACRQGRLAPA